MADVVSISDEDVSTESGDVAYKMFSSTIERELGIPMFGRWTHETVSVVDDITKPAELHIKHPTTDNKGYKRVKLVKESNFDDEKFEYYQECMESTKYDNDGIDAYSNWKKDGKYYTFNLKKLIDMMEYLANEDFHVSVSQTALDAYSEEFGHGR